MPVNQEEQVDLEDWEQFLQLDMLASHWWERPGWRPGRRYLTWYITFDADSQVTSYVQEFQRALPFPYLDPVPADGVHMTIQGVGFADEVTDADVAQIAEQAQARCADLAPVDLAIGPIAAYQGGTFLRATPWSPLTRLRDRLRQAIGTGRSDSQVPAEPLRFKPHISVAYCNRAVPATDLAQAVRHLRSRSPLQIKVHDVDLVLLRREGHAYRWETIATARLQNWRLRTAPANQAERSRH